MFKTFRALYHGVLMAKRLDAGERRETHPKWPGRPVSFGGAYIANPDLVHRLARHRPRAAGDPTTYFMGDENGYTD